MPSREVWQEGDDDEGVGCLDAVTTGCCLAELAGCLGASALLVALGAALVGALWALLA